MMMKMIAAIVMRVMTMILMILIRKDLEQCNGNDCHNNVSNNGVTESVLLMVLQILSFSLTVFIFLSKAGWHVSSFFIKAFVRGHVWHPYVIAGETHWLKTSLVRLVGKVPFRKDFSVMSGNTAFCFCLYHNFLACSVFHCYILPQICIVWLVTFSMFAVSICMLTFVSIFVINLDFPLGPICMQSSFTVFSWGFMSLTPSVVRGRLSANLSISSRDATGLLRK